MTDTEPAKPVCLKVALKDASAVPPGDHCQLPCCRHWQEMSDDEKEMGCPWQV